MTQPLSAVERERYARHLLLPGMGTVGQKKLLSSRVLVVGAGGLGSPVLSYLAAAGVGHITVIDHDLVDSSNLQRQVIHTVDRIGTPKVDSAKMSVSALNPNTNLVALREQLTPHNVAQVVTGHDLVIDGTDNFATRYLLNDVCVALGLPYIWAAIFAYDATLSVFDSRIGPCYRCLHPSPPPAGSVPSCAEGGVLGVLPGHIGTAQATEAIKVLTGVGQPMIGRIASYSALSGEWEYIPLAKASNCPACSHVRSVEESLTALEPTLAACAAPALTPAAPSHRAVASSHRAVAQPDPYLLEPSHLEAFLESHPDTQVIDVRTTNETAIVAIPGARNIELQDLMSRPDQLDSQAPLILFCKTGVRSAQAASALRLAGHSAVFEISGGVMAWISQVSPLEATY